MLHLETGLKIFKIDDGEQHYIVSNTRKSAIVYFMKEFNFGEIEECDLEVRELSKDEDIQVCVCEEDLLLQLINRYRYNSKDKIDEINIWDYLIYSIIESELQKRELSIPFVISSSTF